IYKRLTRVVVARRSSGHQVGGQAVRGETRACVDELVEPEDSERWIENGRILDGQGQPHQFGTGLRTRSDDISGMIAGFTASDHELSVRWINNRSGEVAVESAMPALRTVRVKSEQLDQVLSKIVLAVRTNICGSEYIPWIRRGKRP